MHAQLVFPTTGPVSLKQIYGCYKMQRNQLSTDQFPEFSKTESCGKSNIVRH